MQRIPRRALRRIPKRIGPALVALTCTASITLPHLTAFAADPPVFETPLGIGLLLGRAIEQAQEHQDQLQYALVIEGQNHFKQRRGDFGHRQYGHGQTRVELGNGLGLRLSATHGITLKGLPAAGGSFSPHLGVEPFSGRIALHTQSAIADSYEWLPMVSVGAQFGQLGGGCRLLPLVRAGGGIGNIAKSGWSPSVRPGYGAGIYFNCARMDAAMELTRLLGRAGAPDLNLGTLDWVYTIRPSGTLKVGLRAESDLGRGGSSLPELTEQRILFLLRGELMGDP